MPDYASQVARQRDRITNMLDRGPTLGQVGGAMLGSMRRGRDFATNLSTARAGALNEQIMKLNLLTNARQEEVAAEQRAFEEGMKRREIAATEAGVKLQAGSLLHDIYSGEETRKIQRSTESRLANESSARIENMKGELGVLRQNAKTAEERLELDRGIALLDALNKIADREAEAGNRAAKAAKDNSTVVRQVISELTEGMEPGSVLEFIKLINSPETEEITSENAIKVLGDLAQKTLVPQGGELSASIYNNLARGAAALLGVSVDQNGRYTGTPEDMQKAIALTAQAERLMLDKENPVASPAQALTQALEKLQVQVPTKQAAPQPTTPQPAGQTPAQSPLVPPGVDITLGTGSSGALGGLVNDLAGVFGAGAIFPNVSRATEAINSIKSQIKMSLATGLSWRPNQLLLEEFEGLMVSPARFFQGDAKSLVRWEQLRNFLQKELNGRNEILANPSGYLPKDLADTRKAVFELNTQIQTLNQILLQSGGNVDPQTLMQMTGQEIRRFIALDEARARNAFGKLTLEQRKELMKKMKPGGDENER